MMKKEIIDQRVGELLDTVGMKPHLYGYRYLKDMIQTCLINNVPHTFALKDLLEHTASRFETAPSNIEKDIRIALEITWNEGSQECLYHLYGPVISKEKGKPTTKQFILHSLTLLK